jgi:hypothetical protein
MRAASASGQDHAEPSPVEHGDWTHRSPFAVQPCHLSPFPIRRHLSSHGGERQAWRRPVRTLPHPHSCPCCNALLAAPCRRTSRLGVGPGAGRSGPGPWRGRDASRPCSARSVPALDPGPCAFAGRTGPVSLGCASLPVPDGPGPGRLLSRPRGRVGPTTAGRSGSGPMDPKGLVASVACTDLACQQFAETLLIYYITEFEYYNLKTTICNVFDFQYKLEFIIL